MENSHKDKYIDGLHPHIFKKRIDRTTLFIDLVQYNIFKMMYIKNEINNSERIVKGIMDTHSYFFSNSPLSFICDVYDDTFTNMCKRLLYTLRIHITHILVYVLHKYRENRCFILSSYIEHFLKYFIKIGLKYNIS